MKIIRELLSKKSEISSMRFALLSAIFMSGIIVICTGVYMIINSIKCDIIDWSGITVLLCGIAAFISPFITGKVFQKHAENKENNNS